MKRHQLKSLIRGIIMEAIQSEVFGFGKKKLDVNKRITPQQKQVSDLLQQRGFKLDGYSVIEQSNIMVIRLSRAYGKGRHAGPRYAYVFPDGKINQDKMDVNKYLQVVGESMSKPQDPRFRDGREEAPMGAVNVEEGWSPGEYTPKQQQVINVLQKIGFREVSTFPNQPDADGGGMDDKVTVVLQKKKGPVRLSVEVDAEGLCNGQPAQDFIRSGGTTEEQTGTGAVAAVATPFAFKRKNEMVKPNGRYEDDMESGLKSKSLMGLNEKELEEQTSTGAAAGYQTPAWGGSGKRAMDVTKRLGFKQVEQRPKRTE